MDICLYDYTTFISSLSFDVRKKIVSTFDRVILCQEFLYHIFFLIFG